jgi:hypothetical protein
MEYENNLNILCLNIVILMVLCYALITSNVNILYKIILACYDILHFNYLTIIMILINLTCLYVMMKRIKFSINIKISY